MNAVSWIFLVITFPYQRKCALDEQPERVLEVSILAVAASAAIFHMVCNPNGPGNFHQSCASSDSRLASNLSSWTAKGGESCWPALLGGLCLACRDLLSSSPFQLPPPPLPRSQSSREPGSDFLGLGPSDSEALDSRSSSTLTALTPSRKIRSRSPSLPLLPALPADEKHRQGLNHQRSDSSAYFTALWGSPYELPSSSRASAKGRLNRSRSSTLTVEESPLRSTRKGRPGTRRTHTEQNLRSPPLSRSTRKLLQALGGHREDTATKSAGLDVTRDWLRNHLARKSSLENRNWLSDETSSSDSDLGGNGAGEDWLDFGADTPKPKAKTKSRVSRKSVQHGGLLKQHNSMPSDATLTQRDFDSLLNGGVVKGPADKVMATATMQGSFPPRESSRADKALPPAPHNRTASESPELLMGGATAGSPTAANRPSITSFSSFQRPKKRILWRGKNCIIALPLEDGRDDNGKSKEYLTPRDVARGLEEWEKKGFDTSGFNLSKHDEPEVFRRGQSCEVYPDPGGWSKEWQNRQFRVSIPNRKDWDDYVRELQEQKLRALGVSFGDDEPARVSPTPSASMSRQGSSQSSHMHAHPGMPPSANSSRGPSESIYSPSIPTSANPFARPQSAMSPVIQQGPPGGFHFPRQSMAVTNDQIYGQASPFPLHSSSPHPGQLHPQHLVGSVPVSRGVSPLIESQRHSNFNTQSPVSPMAESHTENPFHGQSNLLPHMRPHEAHVPPPIHVQQQQKLPGPLPPNGQRGNEPQNRGSAEPTKYLSQPEIASPLPQGHRHNVSESLQREIDEAEYHLEESIRRQLEEEDEIVQESAKAAQPAAKAPEEPLPVTDTEPPKKETKMNASDVETNPSLVGSPGGSESGQTKVLAPHSHLRRTSTTGSKLNVNAPEFVFDPTKSFSSNVFTFGAKSGEAPVASSASAAQGLHSKNASNNSAFSSNLNVAAPAFTPGKLQSQNTDSRDFSFSSAMPSFKADAPSFTPSSTFNFGSIGNATESEQTAPKIFSPFDYSDTMPAKRSKAIPIVKPDPDSKPEKEEEDVEDEAGRIMRPDGRQKRMRRGGDSGDQVPLFATPSRDVIMEPGVGLGVPVENAQDSSELRSDAAVSPVAATGQLKTFLEDFKASATSGASSSYEDGEIRERAESTVKTNEAAHSKDLPEAAILREILDDARLAQNSKEPLTETSEPKNLSFEEDKPEKTSQRANGAVTSPENLPDDVDSTPEKKSRLSAAAKPFSLNPVVIPFEPKANPAEDAIDAPAEKKATKTPLKSGLGASRYAPQPLSPPSEPEEELTPSAQVDKEMKARIQNGVSYVEPSYHEIDEVMKQLNGDDSDAGIERTPTDTWQSPIKETAEGIGHSPVPRGVPERIASETKTLTVADPHADVTASPNRLQQHFQFLPNREYGSSDSAAAELVSKSARFSPSFRPQKQTDTVLESPIHRLNSAEIAAISDWDDAISSEDEAKFRARSGFFDSRVNELIGGVVEKRLLPLEQNLASIGDTLAKLSSRSGSTRYRRSVSADAENSDADDEDDETLQSRAVSPLKDRRFERLRASILESVNAHKSSAPSEDLEKISLALAELKSSLAEKPKAVDPSPPTVSAEEFAKLQANLLDLKASIDHQQEHITEPKSVTNEQPGDLSGMLAELKSSLQAHQEIAASGDIKKVIEEAVSKQMRGKSQPVKSSQEGVTVEKLKLHVNGLESMLKITEDRAAEELKGRRAVEDTLAACQRNLKVAESDAAQHREAAEETEDSLRSFLDDQQQSKQHSAMLEEVKASLEKTVGDLTEKTVALEDTLAEYRGSHMEQKQELEEAKSHMKNLDEENQNLDRTIHALKGELEDGIKYKESMRGKLERLQEDMATTAQHFARDQSTWRNKEEEHKAKHELQNARLEAEARTRERLELEIDRLEKQEKEAMKAKYLVEQIRGENNHLVGILNDLRTKNHEVQEHSMKGERELHDLKESSRHEIQRILNATKADVGAANQQVHLLRDNLEAVINRLEEQLESSKNEASNAKKRYEIMLEEASASRDTALREAAEAREAAMQEHYRFHERTLEEAKTSHERAFGDIQAAHEHTLKSAIGDHERSMRNLVQDHERVLNIGMDERNLNENQLRGRLSLADEKVSHLQDRVVHLEEKLEIAKSAAQAAAEAARAARGSTPSPQPARISRGSEVPEKVSPQALRESIMVLQEQLHQRESQIESLEDQLAKVDKDAPNKVKEREVEISWLRELLGVRLDDLQDIITTLSAPSYDRESVRDAAIRLRANLQMEQQEKERAMAGGQRFPSLSEITASPRSLPLAAAAAWGNWRKGQTALSNLAEMAVPNDGSQTPSRSSPQSFLSGLLTPPSTNLRQTPQGTASAPPRPTSSSQRRPLGGFSTPKRSGPSATIAQRREQGKMAPPETPPLLRNASYDQDAPSEHYSLDRYIAEEEDTPSVTEAENEPESSTPSARLEEPRVVLGRSIELES